MNQVQLGFGSNLSDGILKAPQSLIDEAIAMLGNNADVVGAKYRASRLAERQTMFWHEINKNKPESFVANGESVLFATRDKNLFQQVSAAISAK